MSIRLNPILGLVVSGRFSIMLHPPARVGANEDDAGVESGGAYIFRAMAGKWEQEAKLTASDGAEFDFLGRSVAISGDAVLIGAYADDDAGESSGSAYVFRFDGRVWNQEAKLTASDASAGDRFGLAVALSNDVAVIGAAFDKDGGFYSGSVYVYRFDGATWVQEGCVVSAIIKYAHVLRDKSVSRQERIEALKFLVHFVGDVHQPLHLGNATVGPFDLALLLGAWGPCT